MKICIISHDYLPFKEGRGYAIRRIAKNIVKKGVEVHIITRMEKEELLDSLSIPSVVEEGVYVHRIMHPLFGKKEHNPEEIYKIIFFIKKLHEKHKFDIFHGIGIFPCGFIAVNCAKELKRKSVVSGRGGDITINLLKKEDFAVTKWTLENADKLIFVARILLENANKICDCTKKSYVIYNSLDLKEFLYSKGINLPLSGLNVGVIGMMRDIKGIDYLINAFRKFRREIKSRLFVIGFFENKKILDKDIFEIGYVEHKYILNFISKMDIIVIPSLSEGCPNSLLESMYCKKAIIASNVGAIPEIIENGIDGIVIEPFSSEQIYNNLKKLAEKQELRKKLGNEAYKKVKKNFLIDSEVKRIIAIYNSLCKK